MLISVVERKLEVDDVKLLIVVLVCGIRVDDEKLVVSLVDRKELVEVTSVVSEIELEKLVVSEVDHKEVVEIVLVVSVIVVISVVENKLEVVLFVGLVDEFSDVVEDKLLINEGLIDDDDGFV